MKIILFYFKSFLKILFLFSVLFVLQMLHFYRALSGRLSNVDFSMTQIKKTCHGTNFLFKQLSLEHPNKAPFIRDSISSPQTSVFLDSPEIEIMNNTSF
jgi:hypothetical protein